MSNPRIISGSAKGIRLRSVPGNSTRPITDRVKEALFNIIGADIVGSSMLDLFSGTGSVGIEALSRGADYARLLDLASAAINTINYNLRLTHLNERADVIQSNALVYLSKAADRAFDYIYIAPPQYKEIWSEALIALDRNAAWVGQDGWVIVQIHPVEFHTIDLWALDLFDQRRYGSTLLAFYRKQ